jgi:hypothetical protein
MLRSYQQAHGFAVTGWPWHVLDVFSGTLHGFAKAAVLNEPRQHDMDCGSWREVTDFLDQLSSYHNNQLDNSGGTWLIFYNFLLGDSRQLWPSKVLTRVAALNIINQLVEEWLFRIMVKISTCVGLILTILIVTVFCYHDCQTQFTMIGSCRCCIDGGLFRS